MEKKSVFRMTIMITVNRRIELPGVIKKKEF